MKDRSEAKRLKLSLADYEPEDRPLSRETARSHFLDAVALVEPAVLTSLASAPFTEYRRLTNLERLEPDLHTQEGVCANLYQLEHALLNDRQILDEWGRLEPLRDPLLAWSRRWKLTAPWCMGRALRSMLIWSAHAQVADQLSDEHRAVPALAYIYARRWHHMVCIPQNPLRDEPKLQPSLPGWNYAIMPEVEAKAEFMGQAKDA